MKKVLALVLLVAFAGIASAEVSKSTEAASAFVAVASSTTVPNPWDLREGWKPLGTQEGNLKALTDQGKNWISVVILFVNETAYQKKDGSMAVVMSDVTGKSLAMVYGDKDFKQPRWALKVGDEWVAAKEPGFESLRIEAVLDKNQKPAKLKLLIDSEDGLKELVVDLESGP
ncbi:MAG: hypothetical protein Q7S73_00835 [bacterium]|nr:hypothetical protein [bacterium]